MAIVKMKLDKEILSEEEMKELELAEKKSIVFDEDCPQMTEEMLKQFQPMKHSVLVNLTDSEVKKLDEYGGISVVGKLLEIVLEDSNYLKSCMQRLTI